MKKNIAGRFITIVLAFAILILVGGCSSDKNTADVSSDGKEPFTIKYAHNSAIQSINSFWIAEELGFDEEENLNFEDVGAIPAGDTVASVVAGKIDVGGFHVNRTIAGISAGAKIKAVVAGTETSQDIPHMIYVTLDNSSISSPQDIFGKKVGLTAFGGCMENTPYGWLIKNGIEDPKGKFEIITLSTETKLLQALQEGQVDVVGLHKDHEWVAQQEGLKVLFSDYDAWGTLGGATPLYFSENFIKAHPEAVRRFVKVMAKTNNWMNENRQKAREITAQRGNVDVNMVGALHYTPDGIIKEETIQLWIDLLTQFDEIEPGLEASDIYTNEFNDLAKGA